jgi:hypothetical protein
MNIRAMFLASVLAMPLVAGAAVAADTGKLVTAVKAGDRAGVQSMLSGAAKQEIVATQGGAALIWAASRNDKEMVDLLLSAGANAKAVNEFGATALYAAADFADPAVTKRLLAAGADPNVALKSGETPVMTAARKGNAATVRALLEAGADPNAKEKNGGQTALMWAVCARAARRRRRPESRNPGLEGHGAGHRQHDGSAGDRRSAPQQGCRYQPPR